MTLRTLAVRSTIWLTGGQYATALVGLAGNLWLARLLGPEPFGAFLIVSSAADMLFLVVGSFGFGQYLVQAPVITRRHCRIALICTTAISVTAVAAAFGLAWIGGAQFSPAMVSLFLALAVVRAAWTVTLVLTSLLERALAYRALVGCRLAAALGSAAAAIAVAEAGGGLTSFLARELGMVVVGAVATVYAVSRWVRFDEDAAGGPVLPEIWRFGVRLSGAQMLEQAFHRLDGLLLGVLLGVEHARELGWYAQARYVANLPVIAADAGTRAVAYRLYAIVRHDPERLRALVATTQFWTLRLLTPASLVLFVVPEQICRWVLGEEWVAAAPTLRALALFGPFLILFNNLKMLRLVLHDWAGLYRASVVQLLVLVATMVVGVTQWGVAGGAASVTFATAAGYVVLSLGRRGVTRAPVAPRAFAAPGAALAAVVVIGWLWPGAWTGSPVAGILFALGCSLLSIAFDAGALRQSLRDVWSPRPAAGV